MKFIKKIILPLVSLTGLISCVDNNPIPQLIKQAVITTSGVAYNTGETVTIDPLTGKEIPPCGTTNNVFVPQNMSDKKQEKITSSPENKTELMHGSCNTQIVEFENPDIDASFKQAIKISESTVEGMVRDNGVEKRARFIVEVTALYEGSHCVTTYSAGKQRRKCINREQECAALAAVGWPC
jgi:hypothetical protein